MTEDHQFRSGQTLTFASGKPRFRTIVLFGFIAVLAIVAFITGNSRTVAPPENAAGLVVMFMTFSTRFRHRRHTQLPPYSEALLPFHIVPPEPGFVGEFGPSSCEFKKNDLGTRWRISLVLI